MADNNKVESSRHDCDAGMVTNRHTSGTHRDPKIL